MLRGRDVRDITGKTALVTGATRGLGCQLAGDLAAARPEMDTHFFGTLAVNRPFHPRCCRAGQQRGAERLAGAVLPGNQGQAVDAPCWPEQATTARRCGRGGRRGPVGRRSVSPETLAAQALGEVDPVTGGRGTSLGGVESLIEHRHSMEGPSSRVPVLLRGETVTSHGGLSAERLQG